MNLNPFDDRMATLPVFAYTSYQSPGIPPEPSIDRAWTAALVLMLIVMAAERRGPHHIPPVRTEDPIGRRDG